MNKVDFTNSRMASPDMHAARLGTDVVRSNRSAWAESMEGAIRGSSPYPITYDVSQTQSANFQEYAYTELASGVWIYTQSLEINCRLFELASKQDTSGELDGFSAGISDKYKLQDVDSRWENRKKVCFLPGHNMLDVASIEVIARLMHEDQDAVVKPHPITNDEALGYIKTRLGASRVAPKDVSGDYLMKNCETAYVTSASEIAITATALGKKVVNISNFFNEGSGAYHSISRVLFAKHKEGIKEAQNALRNILHCGYSGILFDGQVDIDSRISAYYAKTLELRDVYRPISSPRGAADNGPKPVSFVQKK